MKIYRVEVNADRSQYNERSTHLVSAKNSAEAIRKATREARKTGTYKSYDATSLELVGDALRARENSMAKKSWRAWVIVCKGVGPIARTNNSRGGALISKRLNWGDNGLYEVKRVRITLDPEKRRRAVGKRGDAS